MNGTFALVLDDLRRVAHNVELMAASQKVRIVGFTSALPGEGVSTCIAAISFLLATEGQASAGGGETGSLLLQGQPSAPDRVVLVDANVKNPSLNEAFGLPLQPGLTNAMASTQPFSFGWRAEGEALLVVPAGARGNVVLDPNRLRLTLECFSAKARLVLVDLPSVLRSVDGVKLAKACDAVVMVVRANSTRWEAVAEARRLLERAGVHILGAILNRRRFDLPSWLYERL